MTSPYSPFDGTSGPAEPRLEFVFEIQAEFARMDTIPDMPCGYGRGFVSLSGGRISGPRLNGVILPNTGGDWAMFRPDEVLNSDARYLLQADDGAQILMLNRGFVWGRQPDTMQRMRAWMFEDGPPLEFEEFYLRSSPSFETPKGPYEWMMRHIFVGIGRRQRHGNTIRYYALL
jgi:hypothetical protein